MLRYGSSVRIGEKYSKLIVHAIINAPGERDPSVGYKWMDERTTSALDDE